MSADVVLPVVELGEKPMNSVDGNPDTVNATGPVNPAFRAIVISGGVAT